MKVCNMHVFFVILVLLFVTLPLDASTAKEKLALQLFDEAKIETTLKTTAKQNFPGLSDELAIAFHEDQEKFNHIYDEIRNKHLQKWTDQVVNDYKNLWMMSYTQNFSEAELQEMLDIYRSPLFKKFQDYFNKIDLAHIEQLTQNTLGIMLAYNHLLKESLIEARKIGLNREIIDKGRASCP